MYCGFLTSQKKKKKNERKRKKKETNKNEECFHSVCCMYNAKIVIQINIQKRKMKTQTRSFYPLGIHHLTMTYTQSEIGGKKVGGNGIADTNVCSGNRNIQKEESASSWALIKGKNIQRERKVTLFYKILLLTLGGYTAGPPPLPPGSWGILAKAMGIEFAVPINSKEVSAGRDTTEQSCEKTQIHLRSGKVMGFGEVTQ